MEKKEAARRHTLEHRARVRRLRKTLELSRSQSMAKTYEEVVAQDKKIEERIAREGLTEEEKRDAEYVAAAERDMKAFLQDLPSVGALPADFALGSPSATSSS